MAKTAVKDIPPGSRILFMEEGKREIHCGVIGEYSPSNRYVNLGGWSQRVGWFDADRVEVLEVLPRDGHSESAPAPQQQQQQPAPIPKSDPTQEGSVRVVPIGSTTVNGEAPSVTA